MYTTPPTTVGDDSMVPPVVPFHAGWQVGAPHPFAGNAYSRRSYAPTNTNPFATAGDDIRIDCDPARPCHSGLHTACPHPAAENALSFPAAEVSLVCEPTYTTPFFTVGESMIWARDVELHSGVEHSDWPHPSAG